MPWSAWSVCGAEACCEHPQRTARASRALFPWGPPRPVFTSLSADTSPAPPTVQASSFPGNSWAVRQLEQDGRRRPPDCRAPGETQEGSFRGEGPHLSRGRQDGLVLRRSAGCLLPTPVLALQPDAGCAPRTLDVYVRGHPSTLASSWRPGQAFPFQTLHWAGTEGCSAERSGGEPRAGFRGWDHGTEVQLWPSGPRGHVCIDPSVPETPGEAGGRAAKPS